MKRARSQGKESAAETQMAPSAAHDTSCQVAALEVAARLREILLDQALTDIKSPLASIALATNVLDRLLTSSADRHDNLRAWLDEIRHSATRATLLVCNLRSKDDRLDEEVDVRACSTAWMLQAAVHSVTPLARARRVLLSTEVRTGADQFDCDRTLTIRALVALLVNSVSRTPAGKRVRVVASHTGMATHLCLHDDGDTIYDDEIARMLEPAAQSDDTSTSRPVFFTRCAMVAQGGSLKISAADEGGMHFDMSFATPI